MYTCVPHAVLNYNIICAICFKKTSRFRSVAFRFSSRFNCSGLVRSVHFRSNRLPWANSFSARREFVGKIHCVRWRSIARLFSTTTSRDGFFPTMRRTTGRALSRSSFLGYVWGLEETGALALTCIFYASLSNVLHL